MCSWSATESILAGPLPACADTPRSCREVVCCLDRYTITSMSASWMWPSGTTTSLIVLYTPPGTSGCAGGGALPTAGKWMSSPAQEPTAASHAQRGPLQAGLLSQPIQKVVYPEELRVEWLLD